MLDCRQGNRHEITRVGCNLNRFEHSLIPRWKKGGLKKYRSKSVKKNKITTWYFNLGITPRLVKPFVEEKEEVFLINRASLKKITLKRSKIEQRFSFDRCTMRNIIKPVRVPMVGKKLTIARGTRGGIEVAVPTTRSWPTFRKLVAQMFPA